jgi:glycerol-1-phosphate dehydrogenase [NAD(P)+]
MERGNRRVLSSLGWSHSGPSFAERYAKPYRLPIDECYVGRDAAERLGRYARTLGDSCLLVADENTWRAGGETVAAALAKAGVRFTEHRFGAEPFEATDTLGDIVQDKVSDAAFVLGVGSGTLCDLAKYAAANLGRPAVLYATAASMNGYTSGITALKVRGLKRTLPCPPARAIFANPEDAATAPQRMTAAGVADFLSKSSSATDWRASHILLDVPFDATAREFFDGTTEAVLQAAPGVGEGRPEAVATVLEALMLSGCSMVVAGSSAPASGGEHLISHYLDMKSALYGLPHDLHGTQVGVGTIYTLDLWRRVLALKPADVDVEALLAARPSEEAIAQAIRDDWGPVAPEVQAQWDDKRMDDAAFRAYLERFQQRLAVLRRELPIDWLPPETVADAIAAAGGPVRPEELHAPIEEYRNARLRARYIRNRFTVLDLAGDLGFAP